ncbi:MAG: MFS transporter [Pseudomonadota bacterium]
MSTLASRSQSERGGRLLALALISYFFVFFHRASLSTLGQLLKTDFHLNNTELGWLGSVYFYIYAMMQLPTGIWADRRGIQYPLIGGTTLAAVGTLLFAHSTTFFDALLARSLLSLGLSVILMSCIRLISLIYPPEKFSTFSGLVVGIGSLGAICSGLPLQMLLMHYSWQFIHLFMGGFSLVLAIAIAYCYQKDASYFTLPSSGTTSWQSQLKRVVFNPQTHFAFGVNFFIGATTFGFAGLWGVRFLTQVVHASPQQATLASSLFFLGFSLGSFGLGAFSSKIKRRKLPLFLSATGSFCFTCLLAFGPLLSILLYDVIYIFLGFFGSAFTLAWASSKENNAPEVAAMAASAANIGGFFGPALLQPLLGWLLDHYGNGMNHPFQPVFIAMLCAHVLSLACIAGIRETYCQNQTVSTL